MPYRPYVGETITFRWRRDPDSMPRKAVVEECGNFFICLFVFKTGRSDYYKLHELDIIRDVEEGRK
jgi:hypothetical protein